jgi:multidrug efflux pump subunit AcrA (membrane-fusion protein)
MTAPLPTPTPVPGAPGTPAPASSPATPPGTPPATPPAATPPAPGSGPAGGVDALRADLASERDRRQAAEAELATLRAAEASRAAVAAQAAQAAESAETARVRQQLEAQAQQAQTTAATAIAHLVRSEARRVAVAAGVHDDRSETFLRLVDLTGVQLDAHGIPDAAAIRTAVEAGLTAAPEFQATSGGPRRAPQVPGAPGHGATPTPPADLQSQVGDLLRDMQTTVGITPPPAS